MTAFALHAALVIIFGSVIAASVAWYCHEVDRIGQRRP